MDKVVTEMGKRIARRRKELGLTQDEVAEQAGLTPQTVSSAERGTKALRPENIVKLCQALKTTPNDLLLNPCSELLNDIPPVLLSTLSTRQRQYLEETIRLLIKGLQLKE